MESRWKSAPIGVTGKLTMQELEVGPPPVNFDRPVPPILPLTFSTPRPVLASTGGQNRRNAIHMTDTNPHWMHASPHPPTLSGLNSASRQSSSQADTVGPSGPSSSSVPKRTYPVAQQPPTSIDVGTPYQAQDTQAYSFASTSTPSTLHPVGYKSFSSGQPMPRRARLNSVAQPETRTSSLDLVWQETEKRWRDRYGATFPRFNDIEFRRKTEGGVSIGDASPVDKEWRDMWNYTRNHWLETEARWQGPDARQRRTGCNDYPRFPVAYSDSRTMFDKQTKTVEQAECSRLEEELPPKAASRCSSRRGGTTVNHHLEYGKHPGRNLTPNPAPAHPLGAAEPPLTFQHPILRDVKKTENHFSSNATFNPPQAVEHAHVNRSHFGRGSRERVETPAVEEYRGHYGQRIRCYMPSPQQLPTPVSDIALAQCPHSKRVLQAGNSLGKLGERNIPAKGYKRDPTFPPNAEVHVHHPLPQPAGTCETPVTSWTGATPSLPCETLQLERERGAVARRIQELRVISENREPPELPPELESMPAEQEYEQNRPRNSQPKVEGSNLGARLQDMYEHAQDKYSAFKATQEIYSQEKQRAPHVYFKPGSTTATAEAEPGDAISATCEHSSGPRPDTANAECLPLPKLNRPPTPAPSNWGRTRASPMEPICEGGRKRPRMSSGIDALVDDSGGPRPVVGKKGSKNAKMNVQEEHRTPEKQLSREQHRAGDKYVIEAEFTGRPNFQEQICGEQSTLKHENERNIHNTVVASYAPITPLHSYQRWASEILYEQIPPPPPPRHQVSLLGAWRSYELRWSELSIAPPTSQISFQDVPWPLLHTPTGPESITPDLVSSFVLSVSHSGEKSRKERLHGALLRWNPDMFERRWIAYVKENDRPRVKQAVEGVYMSLILLLHRNHHSNKISNRRRIFIPIPQESGSPVAEPISRQMMAPEVIFHLVAHGCQNLTSAMDLGAFNDHPASNGGSSDVYCGRLLDGTQVALKALRISLNNFSQNRPKHFKQSARELHTWSKCRHPNVLPLLGLAEFRGRIGMVSPWMGQGSLLRYLNRIPGVDRCGLCVQICDGLSYLHEIGIVHGDLKGANVLVSDDGIPVITDFGNSLHTNQSVKFTQTTSHKSLTIRWSAPELLTGPGEPSRAADVYALAMTIYEVMAGTIPYHKKKEKQVLVLLLHKWEPPERPQGIPIGHGDGDKLWKLLGRCWALDPAMRPSASEVAHIMTTINPDGLGPTRCRNIQP
ncbi:unnamed protein product [Rhizoctonia solani]|uniref:Protein kinase domain-containing protein n=1 Tax=Rhizoctonia solani TaxID=456999 RepID=A0A8H3CYN7_9AGAM|nr:unnamed protein product [Rhizoctonia solani]